MSLLQYYNTSVLEIKSTLASLEYITIRINFKYTDENDEL